MKDLRKKLAAAVAMLTISAVMLTGVSYAWYTLSTNPEVTGIKANLAANENLEIALDNGYTTEAAVDAASVYEGSAQGSKTGNPYTWGNLVDLGVAMSTMNPGTGSSGTPKLVLAPVKYNLTADTKFGKFTYPQYGLDGRVSQLGDLTPVSVSDHADVVSTSPTPEGKVALAGGVTAFKQTANATIYDAFSVTYWLRSNEGCNVTLQSTEAKRANSANDTTAPTGTDRDVNHEKGKGSYIEMSTSTENTDTVITNYLKHLVIRFDEVSDTGVVTASHYAKLTRTNVKEDGTTAVDTGKIRFLLSLDTNKNSDATTAASQIVLTANTAKRIVMSVYIDGETLANKDALLDDISEMTMNIQFASSNIGHEGTGINEFKPGAMNGTTDASTYTTP